jgi:glycosyltransferase involved in cell wall biosynthesis
MTEQRFANRPDMKNLKISVVLCTYNEDCYLDECLASVSWADEIVLCDMGSSDRTLEIARAHGCKIHSVRKVDYIEQIRHEVVNFCENGWICFIDPDFVFPAHYAGTLRRAIAEDPEITCVNMAYVNHYKGRPVRHGRWGKGGVYPVLFRKDAMELRDILHAGYRLKFGVIFNAPGNFFIRHMWMRDETHFVEKASRYIEKEGENRLKLGYKPSILRKARLLLSMLLLYVSGGFLDGRIGYELFKRSIWYEIEAEKMLKKAYKKYLITG